MKSLNTASGAGSYSVQRNIPDDVVGSSTRHRAIRFEEGDEMRRLTESIEQLLETVQRIERQQLDHQEQVANQLAEIVARVGRMDRRLSSSPPDSAPISSRQLRPVTDEEVSKGAHFWIRVDTGGKRTAHEVEILPGFKDDGEGNLSYYFRRVDGVTQGPQAPRPAAQLFRSREEAEAAPRATSGKSSRVSVRKG